MNDEVHEIESALRQFSPQPPELDWKAIWIEQGRSEVRAELAAKSPNRSNAIKHDSTDLRRWQWLSGLLSVACGLLLVLMVRTWSGTTVPTVAMDVRSNVQPGASSANSSLDQGRKAVDSSNDVWPAQVVQQTSSDVDLQRLVKTGNTPSLWWSLLGHLIFQTDWSFTNMEVWRGSPESRLYRAPVPTPNQSFVNESIDDPVLLEWQTQRSNGLTPFSLWKDLL